MRGRAATAAIALGCGALSMAGTYAPPPDVALTRAATPAPSARAPAPSAPTTTTSAPPAIAASPPTTTARSAHRDDEVLLVWVSGGLPDGFADQVRALPEVREATVVAGDLLGMTGSVGPSGAVVDQAPESWAIPIDAFAVDPGGYARFQPAGARDVLASLEPGQAVLGRTSAALRRLDAGGELRFSQETVRVVGVVDDDAVGGAEVVVHRDDAARLGIDDDRFLLVADRDRTGVERGIRALTPPGAHLSLRSSTEAAWLRHGDRVQPQALVKATFGEFAFRDRGGRDIEIDPAWLREHIATEAVPILGTVTCHRTAIPLVRAAMAELEARGRADAVDPSSYAGCHYPRRIAPGAGLSRHSWGIALDLNIRGNPRGTFESQDDALVRAMTTRGFDWGGEWEYPDPGHYELRAPG